VDKGARKITEAQSYLRFINVWLAREHLWSSADKGARKITEAQCYLGSISVRLKADGLSSVRIAVFWVMYLRQRKVIYQGQKRVDFDAPRKCAYNKPDGEPGDAVRMSRTAFF
jgi:hypothetical protein